MRCGPVQVFHTLTCLLSSVTNAAYLRHARCSCVPSLAQTVQTDPCDCIGGSSHDSTDVDAVNALSTSIGQLRFQIGETERKCDRDLRYLSAMNASLQEQIAIHNGMDLPTLNAVDVAKSQQSLMCRYFFTNDTQDLMRLCLQLEPKSAFLLAHKQEVTQESPIDGLRQTLEATKAALAASEARCEERMHKAQSEVDLLRKKAGELSATYIKVHADHEQSMASTVFNFRKEFCSAVFKGKAAADLC